MKNKASIYVLIIIVLVIVLTFGIMYALKSLKSTDNTTSTKEITSTEQQTQGNNEKSSGRASDSSVDKVGATEFTSDIIEEDKEYESTNSDENAVLVKDGANQEVTAEMLH